MDQKTAKRLPFIGNIIWFSIGAIVAVAVLLAFPAFRDAGLSELKQDEEFARSGSSLERYQKHLDLQAKNRFWAEKIIKGGYILHIRHAQRERWRDASAFDAYELYSGINPLEVESGLYRATCLTRRGIEEARLMNKILELAGIRASQVFSSPSCRATMTAEFALGPDYTVENSLLARTAIMPEQHEEFDERLREFLMGLEIVPDANVILTGHGATLGFTGGKILDEIAPDAAKDREETGIYVIERVGDKLIMQYTFTSMRDLANVVIRVPLESKN